MKLAHKALFLITLLVCCSAHIGLAQCVGCSGCGTTTTATGGATTALGTITVTNKHCIVYSGAGTATITGAVTIGNGGTVVMCTSGGTYAFTGTMQIGNAGSSTAVYEICSGAIVTHSQDFTNPLFGNGGTFNNYGSFTATSTDINNNGVKIVNHGTFALTGANRDLILSVNGTSNTTPFENRSGATVSGTRDLTLNAGGGTATFLNSGTVTFTRDFTSSGTTPNFTNNSTGRVTFSGNFTRPSAGTLTNQGKITAGGTLNFGGGGGLVIGGGRFYGTNFTMTSGSLALGAGACASFYVTGNTTINCGLTYTSGQIWIYDATPSAGGDGVCSSGADGFNTGGGTYGGSDADGSPCPVLPVTWLSINTNLLPNGSILLDWATAVEKNNKKFTILRSNDGIQWEAIGTVAGHGNSTDIRYYNFEDTGPFYGDVVYYKIAQQDFDNTVHESRIVAQHLSGSSTSIQLFPNPVGSLECTLELEGEPVEALSLIDSRGIQIASDLFFERKNNNQWKILLPNHIDKGAYILNIQTPKQHYHIKLNTL